MQARARKGKHGQGRARKGKEASKGKPGVSKDSTKQQGQRQGQAGGKQWQARARKCQHGQVRASKGKKGQARDVC